MPKQKSLNYPALSLAEAIAHVDRLYQSQINSRQDTWTASGLAKASCLTTPEYIAEVLGYSTTDEAAALTISALLKFGLLANVGSELQLTEDAENILLLSHGHPERAIALKNVAFAPYLFSKLHHQFGEELPHDDVLRCFLMKQGFSAKTGSEVIRAYRETIEFIRESENLPLSENFTPSPEGTVKIEALSSTSEISNQTLIFRLAEGCTARIELGGVVTQEAIAKLIVFLQLSADTFPTC